jgi:hypothetical protein
MSRRFEALKVTAPPNRALQADDRLGRFASLGCSMRSFDTAEEALPSSGAAKARRRIFRGGHSRFVHA